MSWFTESNRYKHFLLAIPFGVVFTILCALGLALGMEFKDCHYANGDKPLRDWNWSNWDWLDFAATILGGLVGQIIQIAIILPFIL